MVRALSVIAVLLLVGCQTGGGTFCQIARPDRPSAEEIAVMTDARAAEKLAYNLKGQKLCGWKP